MTGADLRALEHARYFAADLDERIEVVTWNRKLTSLDKWVACSLDAELLAEEPFRYVDQLVLTPQGPVRVRVNAEAENRGSLTAPLPRHRAPQDLSATFVAAKGSREFQLVVRYVRHGKRGAVPVPAPSGSRYAVTGYAAEYGAVYSGSPSGGFRREDDSRPCRWSPAASC
ncbi:hypothetical protein OH733_34000 [Streptomyces griseus]|uniref:hypothetical protein n=1 Tax=Streptomyces griseus TaxID=1911 RepID=UPI003864BA65|nr:hypothetical protein OG554_03010 [Streptomyces fimicarius]WTC91443.1 hypothetical protein OH733_34000 [Streptomyces griseus]WTD65924.1 hypothetical protein OH763_02990 [Streptomyces griseus]